MQKQSDILRALLLALLLVSGCAYGEGQNQPPTTRDDQGMDMGTARADDGIREEEDLPSTPDDPVLQRTVSPTGGGASLETEKHRMRLMIAPPSPAGSIETSKYRIKLGAGSTQHGQGSR